MTIETEYRELDFLGFPEYRVGTDGSFWSRKNKEKIWRERKLTPDENGYLRAKPQHKGISKTFRMGPLVLLCFIGPRPDGYWCCHNNGDRKDNRLSNLRWDTPQNNQLDKIKHGTIRNGEMVNSSKLTEEDVLEIRRLLEDGNMKQCDISKMFGVSEGRITCIKNGKDWKHLTNGVNLKPNKHTLTVDEVRKIKRKLQEGETLINLAKEFQMSVSAIRNIKYNHNWKHVSLEE